MANIAEDQDWTTIIRPKSGLFDFGLKEIRHYKFLMYLFVRRDFVSQYKQTVLGPLWLIIQPIFTTGIYSIIFGGLAKIPTDGVPQPVFYMAGITLWSYFSSCLGGTAGVFSSNAGIFGKVYFPRLTVPITITITRLYTFMIQLIVFLVVYIVYAFRGATIRPNLFLLLLPVLVAHSALLGMAVGLWSSALTVKYRDVSYLVGFGVSLWMWATPIVYPISFIPEKYRFLIYFNPMAPIVETFRFGATGAGGFPLVSYLASLAVTAIVLFVGLVLFHKAEQTFIDVA
jgi:lipopolysaccharide transport system permease protein